MEAIKKLLKALAALFARTAGSAESPADAATEDGECVGIAPPLNILIRQMRAFFRDDPQIQIIFDSARRVLEIHAATRTKADALAKIVPGQYWFGKNAIPVRIVPGEEKGEDFGDPVRNAFAGNYAVERIVDHTDAAGNGVTYVDFRPQIVQYHDFESPDPYGLTTTFFASLAEDLLLGLDNTYYTTAPLPADAVPESPLPEPTADGRPSEAQSPNAVAAPDEFPEALAGPESASEIPATNQ